MPLTKVWVDYEPHPKNRFVVNINDEDYYCLVKEEIDFDPSHIEALKGTFKINEKVCFYGSTPWISDVIEDKIAAV